MCFLAVQNVMHGFAEAGTFNSVTNWLMNYGGNATPRLENEFYQSTDRPTKASLDGKFMAVTIDVAFDPLLDRADTINALTELPDDETLFSDDVDYLASVAAGQLRILTSALGTYTDDAFVLGDPGDTGDLAFGSAGARVTWIDTSDDSAEDIFTLLPDADNTIAAAIFEGYASGFGSTDTADALDGESFFEMLRIGTFAEAVFVASPYLKSTALGAGSPLLQAPFQQKGYNVYHGMGGPEAIDWSAPIAYIVPGRQTHTTILALAGGQKHVFGIRAISAAGVSEHNSHIITAIELDAQGNLLGSPLSKVTELTASMLANNSVRLEFSYQPMIGTDSPESFEVCTDSGAGSYDLDNPISAVAYIAAKVDFEVTLAEPTLPASFVVRAVRSSQAGPLSKPLPLTANPAPQAATVFQE